MTPNLALLLVLGVSFVVQVVRPLVRDNRHRHYLRPKWVRGDFDMSPACHLGGLSARLTDDADLVTCPDCLAKLAEETAIRLRGGEPLPEPELPLDDARRAW